ncbi:MAG: hypothetical protein ACLTBV_17345 [Enterocloster bolteae]
MVYPADVRQDGPLDVFMAHMDVVFFRWNRTSLRGEDGRMCPGGRRHGMCWYVF